MKDSRLERARSGGSDASPPGTATYVQKRALPTGGYVQQMAALRPVQAHGGGAGAADIQSIAAAGVQGSGGSLPHLGTIQQSFGPHKVDHIQAYGGSAAAQACDAMGATAYATGAKVAHSGSLDLHTAAHEAAHVVQQKAGVQLAGGVGAVGDAYEQHADAVADRVVQGKSAVDLLDRVPSGSAGGAAVQMKPGDGDQISPADVSRELLEENNYPVADAHVRLFVRNYFKDNDYQPRRMSTAKNTLDVAIRRTIVRATVDDGNGQIKVKVVNGVQYVFHKEANRTIFFCERNRAALDAQAQADLLLFGGALSQLNAARDIVLQDADMAYAGQKHVACGSRNAHFKASNHKIGQADDYMTHGGDALVWHHHHDHNRMQLIDRPVHESFNHWGGFQAWG